MKIYQDPNWLYHHYVTKRMNMAQICEILDRDYNIQISHQALYNWCKKFDLLKYRGKGRKLNSQFANVKTKRKVRPKPQNPAAARMKYLAAQRKKSRRPGR